MTDGVQYAGEFDIEEAILFSPNGEITDLMTDVSLVEINLYEDIFKSSITGSVVVADIADIITKLPIMGQEKISLKMSTPSLTEKKDFQFTTDQLATVKKTKTNRIALSLVLKTSCSKTFNFSFLLR